MPKSLQSTDVVMAFAGGKAPTGFFLACPRLSSPWITLQIVADITEASLLVSASAFILQVLLHVSYMSLTCLLDSLRLYKIVILCDYYYMSYISHWT